MSSEDELNLVAVACVCIIKKRQHLLNKRSRPRIKWVKEWLLKRNEFSHINLLEELRLEPDDWRNYLRMDEDSYTTLLTLVTPLIEKQDTIMRPAISAHERLSATLRYLATGRNYEDLKFSTVISPQSLCYIIPDTCSAIYKVLKNIYMKVSKSRYATVYAPDNILYRENHEDGTVEIGSQANDMASLQRGYNRRTSKEGKEVRQLFMNYFNSNDGAVAWQEKNDSLIL
ncbi:hypothetical protein NQ317_014971 [Molorchus minor]|uniref:Uncharacterized protein n=1 Tax=Molorchus minor TaxID=1323400 RepID=A0ABQ9J306_9CUCU|nr:hypothetical protein NQ317_014971 [Molorchus minor]